MAIRGSSFSCFLFVEQESKKAINDNMSTKNKFFIFSDFVIIDLTCKYKKDFRDDLNLNSTLQKINKSFYPKLLRFYVIISKLTYGYWLTVR